jgi:Tol biopolymer transport system component
MRPNGTHQRRLGSERYVWTPAWSPDGKWIAYAKGRLSAAQLYLMRADGTHVRRLMHDRNSYLDPNWAPDGKRIVFTSSRPGGLPGIWTMNLNGTGLRLLTDKGDTPAWSPDGTTIAFRSRYPEAIWLMNPDGSNQRQLTTPLQRKAAQSDVDMQPDWSPDSKWIAFSRQHPANREWQRDIFVVRRDGTGLRQLTSHHHLNGWAAWSPDATRIAFWSDRDHRDLGDIYVMKANGSGQRRLTRGLSDEWPDWRPLRAQGVSHSTEGER